MRAPSARRDMRSPPANLSQNCRLLSIRYKCRMIRLTDEQWERIRDHFPEENIADGRPGRRPIPTRYVLEAVLWILQHRRAMAHAAAELPELQNCASALSD